MGQSNIHLDLRFVNDLDHLPWEIYLGNPKTESKMTRESLKDSSPEVSDQNGYI